MRPEILNPLFAEVDTLDGVGPKLKKPLEKLRCTRVRDIAYHWPDRFVTRRPVDNLDEAGEGEQIIVALTVTEHRAGASRRAPYKILATDSAGNVLALTFFGRSSYTAKKQLPVGEQRRVAGKLERYGDMLQMVHPDHILKMDDAALGQMREPIYPLAEGLTQPRMASLSAQALDRLPAVPEWIEPGMLAQQKWPAWADALRSVHARDDETAKDRLAYD